MSADITQTINDAIVNSREEVERQNELARAQKEIKRELRQAIRKINKEFSVSTEDNLLDEIKALPGRIKNDGRDFNIPLASNVLLATSAIMAPWVIGVVPTVSGVLSALGMMLGGVFSISSASVYAEPWKKGGGNMLLAPFRYACRAATGQSIDPRLWRRNAKQMTNEIWDGLEASIRFHLAREYIKDDGINDEIATILSNNITKYMKDHIVLKNKDSAGALPAIFEAVLTDPHANPKAIIKQGAAQSRALPDFSGNSIKRGQQNPRLDVQVPDTKKAEQKLKEDLSVFDADKIGLSAVVMFGNAASHEAQEVRQKIHHWQIHQHASLPPSLEVMNKILDGARALRDFVLADPAQNRRGLKALFPGGKNTEDKLYNTAVSIMKNAAALRGTIESDIKNFENLLDDNEKAQDALEAHADILESYSKAFNEVASDLKKKTTLRLDGKRLVRFTPDTINQTREGLSLNALTARQEAAAYEHIHQPEQEFLLRTLPVLAARSTEITKVLEGAYRHSRLKEMAALAGKSGEDRQLGITVSDVKVYCELSADARKQIDLQVVAELDAVLNPWEKTLQEVKEVFALEDYRDKRLQITYQPIDENGRAAPGSIKVVPNAPEQV